jgi:hypothetical protein
VTSGYAAPELNWPVPVTTAEKKRGSAVTPPLFHCFDLHWNPDPEPRTPDDKGSIIPD